jgi:Rrf2 family cysteine metabolism transcriptional repressor
MKLTNKSEYALLALVALARNYPKGLVSGDFLAEQQGIPKRFLQQILFALKQGGFVRSVKGKAGGYMLARDPRRVSVAEIVRFFEGPLAPTTSVSQNYYHPSPIEHEQGLITLFAEIRDRVAQVLEGTTLAEVSAGKSGRCKR